MNAMEMLTQKIGKYRKVLLYGRNTTGKMKIETINLTTESFPINMTQAFASGSDY